MRQLFSSRLATVFTMVGLAVGLGNVWRFPYMMGRYGGSAFLIIYLVFVAMLSMPALTAEWALGRATRRGPLGALSAALGRRGRPLGYLLLLTVLVANSYYLVVLANVAYSAAFSIGTGFTAASLPAYQRGLDTGWLQALTGLGIVGLAMLVLHRGLHRGIELVSKMFVPFFGLVVVYLIVMSLSLPTALGHLEEFLQPDFRALTTTSVFAALGQAFFSLSLGGTFHLIYGSYLRDEENIPVSAAFTAAGDTTAALLAALFIVPTTLVFGLDLESGPQLIFHSLPRLFEIIPGGRVMGSLLLLALLLVAFLSSIAAFQVLIGALEDSFGMPAGRAVLVVGAAEAVLMLPTAFHPDLIAVLDLITGSGMQMLGSALALVALTWGLGRATTLRQVFGRESGPGPALYWYWIRWLVPAALALMLGLFVLEAL